MATLGDILRDSREARGISLSEAERDTKIRAKYIAALEDNNLAALPGPVYARGFLRNYAGYLGLDPQETVDLFDQESQPTRNKIRAARGEPVAKNGKSAGAAVLPEKISIQPLSPQPVDTRVRYGSSYITLSLLAVPLLIIFYLVYSIWGVNRSTTLPIPTPRPPTLTPMPIPTQINTNPGTGAFNTPTTAAAIAPSQPVVAPTAPTVQTTPAAPRSDVTVKVAVTKDAWMQVSVDGKVQYSGTLKAGSTRQWTGKSAVRIRTGRADAVGVTVNDVNKGTMQVGTSLIITKEWDTSGNEKVVK